jgi:predicted nucleotidyltransferase
MSAINSDTTREQLAAIVAGKLNEHGIDAVLVGGAVVSIYTNNKYASNDLDFISPAAHKRIAEAMDELGFTAKGKDFLHPDTKFTVEFPTGPIGIGDDQPVTPEGRMLIDGVEVKMLSPTQSVMDRLIAFFVFNDRQCLDQALWIAESQPVNMSQVEAWAKRERYEEKYQVFVRRLQKF